MKKRRDLRLKKFDYSSTGIYFVTIVTQFRKIMFGEVVDNEIILNLAGEMVRAELENLADRYEGLKLGAYVIMPNHLHLNLHFEDQEKDATLGDVICAFKSISTHNYIKGVREDGWPTFEKRFWQRVIMNI